MTTEKKMNTWQCDACKKSVEVDSKFSLLQCPDCGAVFRKNNSTENAWCLVANQQDIKKLYRDSKNLKIAAVLLGVLAALVAVLIFSLPISEFITNAIYLIAFILFAVLVENGRRGWCRILILIMSFLFSIAGVFSILRSDCASTQTIVPGADSSASAIGALFPKIVLFVIFLTIFISSRNKNLFGENAPTHAQLRYIAKQHELTAVCDNEQLWERGLLRKKLFSFTMIVFYIITAASLVGICVKYIAVDSDDLYKQGSAYFNGNSVTKNKKKAFDCFLRGANAGHGKCQAMVAYFYFRGDDNVVKQDLSRGLEYATKAAEQNAPLAYNLLALYYLGEFGASVADPEKLFYWSKKEYESGMTTGALHLGVCYINGSGCGQDLKKGMELITTAANNGSPDAYVILAMYNLGFYDEKYLNPKEAFFWSEKAMNANHLSGKACMGFCLLNGIGCTADEKNGMALLQEAATSGDMIARQILSLLKTK